MHVIWQIDEDIHTYDCFEVGYQLGISMTWSVSIQWQKHRVNSQKRSIFYTIFDHSKKEMTWEVKAAKERLFEKLFIPTNFIQQEKVEKKDGFLFKFW